MFSFLEEEPPSDCIGANLSLSKIGTKSMKKWDFWSKIGTFLKYVKNSKLRDKKWSKLPNLETK